MLTAHVRALKDIERRNAGEPVETPALALPPGSAVSSGKQNGSLRDAFEGWKKERERPEGTVHEYGRAVEMFIQLHGNLQLVDMRRSHARTFREELQMVPKVRRGALLKASPPELSEHGRANPSVTKVSAGTINKQLGAVQAITGWGQHNGLVPDDVLWADPFAEMRLEGEQSDREPYDADDLQAIFDAPLFTEHRLPVAAKGAAGVWLPLLTLFAGARQAEYAGLAGRGPQRWRWHLPDPHRGPSPTARRRADPAGGSHGTRRRKGGEGSEARSLRCCVSPTCGQPL